MPILPRFKHQDATLKKQRNCPRFFDLSDPGTAKTRVQLDIFAERRRRKGKKMLVLAPRSILQNAWGQDAAKYVPDMKVSIATALNRAAAFAANADIYVTNHDAVNWLAKQRPSFFADFDTLTIDESPAFKHHTSGRSRALAKIKKYFPYRTAMTGTPSSRSITDIWHQVNVLDDGKRLGSSFYAFRSTVCEPVQVGHKAEMIEWHDRPGAEDVVASLLENMSIRHLFDNVMTIPPTHKFVRDYYLTPKQIKAYKSMERDAIALLKKGAVTAINQAAVRTKLLQIASGAVYESPDKYHLIDTDRYEYVMDLVQERKHSLVFYLWKHQRDELLRIAKARKITYCVMDGDASDKRRIEIEQEYQNGFYQVMFAHPKSAAHGLTLTKGTATIWPSPTDDVEWWVQGNRRQARAGQTQNTEIIAILANQTIEGKVYANMEAKQGRMQNLLELFEEAA